MHSTISNQGQIYNIHLAWGKYNSLIRDVLSIILSSKASKYAPGKKQETFSGTITEPRQINTRHDKPLTDSTRYDKT